MENNKIVINENTKAIRDTNTGGPIEVHVDSNNIERAIRAMKRKLIRTGFYKEQKQRRFFEKPCVKKKRKTKEAVKRVRKDEQRLKKSMLA